MLPTTAIDAVSEFTCRSATGNCKWRTCPGSLHGGLSGIRTHDPPVQRHWLNQCAITSHVPFQMVLSNCELRTCSEAQTCKRSIAGQDLWPLGHCASPRYVTMLQLCWKWWSSYFGMLYFFLPGWTNNGNGSSFQAFPLGSNPRPYPRWAFRHSYISQVYIDVGNLYCWWRGYSVDNLSGSVLLWNDLSHLWKFQLTSMTS